MKRCGLLFLLCLTLLAPLAARADDTWIVTGADGRRRYSSTSSGR
jgi:hypothetical protein